MLASAIRLVRPAAPHVARASSSPASAAAAPAAAPAASKYALPNGLQLKGTVVAAGRMAQTVSVQVERRMTDHKTLKASEHHHTLPPPPPDGQADPS